jgi:hypothetical protein
MPRRGDTERPPPRAAESREIPPNLELSGKCPANDTRRYADCFVENACIRRARRRADDARPLSLLAVGERRHVARRLFRRVARHRAAAIQARLCHCSRDGRLHRLSARSRSGARGGSRGHGGRPDRAQARIPGGHGDRGRGLSALRDRAESVVHPCRAVRAGHRHWNRLSDQPLLRLRDHAKSRTQPDDGRHHRVAIGRHDRRGSGRHRCSARSFRA